MESLHWMGILGCGKPIYIRVWWGGTISLAHMKRPESSASAAKDMKKLMICAIVRTVPLILGM